MAKLTRQRDTTREVTTSVLVLASASPRRRDLLRATGVSFEVEASGIPEEPGHDEPPAALAGRLARAKALDVSTRRRGRWVLGADTVVIVDSAQLGKPRDAADAARMLRLLSGRDHEVLTAFSLIDPTGRGFAERSVRTRVVFRSLDPAEIAEYVDSGEPFGKAGAYAIQERAGRFVRELHGSYTNVVGLPMESVAEVLRAAGLWPSSNDSR